MVQILLIEDDSKLSQLIKEYLEKQGFMVNLELKGGDATSRILREDPDVVILDLMLPGKNGLEICKEVRTQYKGIILILTACERADDHVTGLELGADDYVTKPIDPKILVARIKSLLKRKTKLKSNISKLVFGKLSIDLNSHSVTLDEQTIDLKPKEFELLALLARNSGNTISRDLAMLTTRGIEHDGIDRSIDLRISYLRKKLNDNIEKPYRIKTVRGKGYVFVPNSWK